MTNRFTRSAGMTGSLVIFAIWAAAAIGWVLNALKVVTMALNGFEGSATEAIIRVAGVFVLPLGAIAGWV